MNNRKMLALALLALFALVSVGAQEHARGALFQVGAGAYFPSYPSQAEADFVYLESMPGVDRVKLSLDIALGAAISEQAYLMARVDGAGDRLYDGYDYLQLNLYLYSLGLRFYPDVTGFYLEGEVGGSRAVLQASGLGDSSTDFALGFGAAVGYDFNRAARGFGLCLEARYDSFAAETERVGAFMVTLDCCWK